MYSRFVIWQNDPIIEAQAEINEYNVFRVQEKCLDIRFILKGYGFKKVGEINRAIYHFGCYKCYYKKVGDPQWQMFAHVVSDRAGVSEATVYKDVIVSTGVLEYGTYEIKVEACRLVELSNWPTGVVEGIASGDQFYYDVSARTQAPNKVSKIEEIDVSEFFYAGLDPIFLEVIDPEEYSLDGVQAIDIAYMVLEHNIYGIWEDIPVNEVLTIQYDYDLYITPDVVIVTDGSAQYLNRLHVTPANFGDRVYVNEYRSLTFTPFYSYWFQQIFVNEWAFGNIYGTCQNWDTIAVRENADVNIYGCRQVFDTVDVGERITVNIPGLVFDNVDVRENIFVNVFGSRLVFEEIPIEEFVAVNVFGSRLVYETIFAQEVIDVHIPWNRLSWEIIFLSEYISVNIPFARSVSDEILTWDIAFVFMYYQAFVSEKVSTSENIQVHIPFSRIVFDPIAVLEYVSVNRAGVVEVFQDISVNEFASLNVIRTIQVFEQIEAMDVLYINIDRTIQVSDIIHADEFVTIAFQAIKVLSVSDSITVNEYVAYKVYGTFSVDDDIFVNEFVKISVLSISAVQNITVSEFVLVSVPNLSNFDTVTITESVTVRPIISIDVFESIAIVENLSAVLIKLVNVYDTITVTEFATNFYPVLGLSVYDYPGIANDWAWYKVYGTFSVYESINVQSVYSTLELRSYVDVSDTIIVNENVMLETIIAIVEVTGDDSAFVNGALVDYITVVEEAVSFDIYYVVEAVAYETIVSTESIIVAVLLGFDLGDSVGVSGALFDTISVTEFINVIRI